ncbi:MAG: hypothetical protein HY719_01805 [Planctomycetes bacterium]|nr:hypothetical protein [Planctomycetota bacterium]
MSIVDDVSQAKRIIKTFPRQWDGKKCVLEMKDAKYNWRQTEWWAFYWEMLFVRATPPGFEIPGERVDRVRFDLKGVINWDLKGKAIKSDDHHAILNDKAAVDKTISGLGSYGAIIALCDVEYNDENRTFQRWREQLQGGKSKYQKEREARTPLTRYRKTRAELREVLFLCFDKETIKICGIMRQGRNSNGKPRPPKYIINLEKCESVLVARLALE